MSDTIKIGEMVYKITGDSSGLKAALKNVDLQLDKTKKKATNFGSVLKKALAGGAVLMAGKKLLGFFADATKAASNAEETAQKFGVVYRDIAGTANATAADIAKSFGVAEVASQKLLGDTGDLLTGFGFTQKAALDLSDQVVRLGLDLSSFANVDQDFAVEGLRKALLGETEQAKSLGIVINQTTKEFRNAVKQKQISEKVTLQQAKAMVILETATKQSKNAIGDFARSAGSFANQQKILNARFDDFKVAVGGPVRDALRLLQKDMIDGSTDAEGFGNSIGQIAGKAVLSFRIARDAVLKYTAEFDSSLNELAFKTRMNIADLANLVGADSIAAKFKRSAAVAGVAWADNEIAVLKYNKRLVESLKAWDNLGKKPAGVEDKTKGLIKPTEAVTSSVKKQADAWLKSKKAAKEMIGIVQSVGAQVTNVLSGVGALTDAIFQKRIDELDATMEAELRTAGVLEETQVEQAQKEYDSAIAKGDLVEIDEKKRALTKSKIEEKYAKKRAILEHKGALASWQLQMATAAIGIPIATMQGLITGWGAGWPLGMVLGPLFAGLAGAAATLQLGAVAASKPSPPKFAEGGIVPGTSYSGDNVSAQVNSGEMVLNKAQQKNLFDMAQGGGGGGTVNLIIDGTVFGKVLYNMSQNGDMLIDAGAITTK